MFIKRSIPLKQQVYNVLKERVLGCSPKDQLENERELAESLEVSRDTVRSALKELEKEGLIRRKQGEGTFVTDAVMIKTAEVLYYNVSNRLRESTGVYANSFAILEQAVQDAGHRVRLIGNPSRSLYKGPLLEEINKDGETSLLVTLGIMHEDYIQGISELDLPVVCIDFVPLNQRHDSVTFNSFGAGRMLTDHMIEQGHARIGYVGFHRKWGGQGAYQPEPDSIHLQAGYEYSLKQHLIKVNPAWIMEIPHASEETISIVIEMWNQGEGPTAMIFFDLLTALNFIKAVEKDGYSVPKDVSVACYSGDGPDSKNEPDLTRIYMDATDLGMAASQIIVNRLLEEVPSSAVNITINGHFVKGSTSAPPKKK
jgi:DNA-binding LacI/PurR family transcriptional regulator